MKISVRLTIVLLVVAMVPMLVTGIWSWIQGEQALVDLGEASIRQMAESVAREMELYLALHPEVDLDDAAGLEANAELQEIAVRYYGEEGYTAVFDDQAVTHFHPSSAIIGQDLRVVVANYPDFLQILEASLDGTPAAGYYEWPDDPGDPNSGTRSKYMSVVPVGDTPLRVASTTYIDEFSAPLDSLRFQLVLILLAVGLAAVVAAWLLGRWFSQPIYQVVHTAAQIADGDLTAEPPTIQVGEFGLLADAFRRMTHNLSALIHQVQAMSLSLSSAAEQVTITHREHTANSGAQAAAVTNSGSAVEELATSAAHIADTAQLVVSTANQTQADAQAGVGTMEEAAEGLERIWTSNQEAVAKVRTLGDLAREIGVVMDLIEDIAAQTRMIAFNASIEASAAGAVGRRFAVVAGEVRRLAGDVAQSTEEIRAKIERIQTTTNELIVASEREIKEIEAGQTLGQTMTDILDQIHFSARQTTQAAQQISLGTRQQHSATEQVLDDLRSLATGAQAVAASSKQTVDVMEDLVGLAQGVNRTIERFTLPGGETPLVEEAPIEPAAEPASGEPSPDTPPEGEVSEEEIPTPAGEAEHPEPGDEIEAVAPPAEEESESESAPAADAEDETTILPRETGDEAAEIEIEVPAELEMATGGAAPEGEVEISDQDDET